MKRLLLSAAALFAMPYAASAQDAADAPVEEIEDVVIVEGVRRGGDPAMDAWYRGDFKQAEIEFEKNFSRLKQGVRLKQTQIEQNASDALQTQILSGANTGSAGSQEGADAGLGADAQSASLVYTNQRFRPGDQDPNIVRSGTDLGAQLYMAGLSELKLGKFSEAKESFERALFYNDTLHDARLRLGLLALQDNDADEARKQLRRLEARLKSCHSACERYGDREILENGVAQLKQFLG